MSWTGRPLVAFDLETTAPDPDAARIVTATAVVLRPGQGQPQWDVEAHEWMADPGVAIPAGAAAIHGVSTERARAEGRPTREVLADLVPLLGRSLANGYPIVGHNVVYDLTVLDRECRRQQFLSLSDALREVWPVIDTLVLDKAMHERRRGKRTLTAVAAHYGVPLADGDAHNATADAMAAVRVLWRIAAAYPGLRTLDLRQLHDHQVGWRHHQATGLQEYLRRTDPTATVNPAWPIQPLPQGWNPEHHPDDDQPAAVSTPPLTGSST